MKQVFAAQIHGSDEASPALHLLSSVWLPDMRIQISQIKWSFATTRNTFRWDIRNYFLVMITMMAVWIVI